MNKIIKSFLVATILDIIISFLEIFTSFRLPVSPYTDGSIPTGFHWNPNNLAAVMVLVLPFFLFHPKRIAKFLGSIAIIVIIFMADSRGNLLALAFLLTVWFIFYLKTKGKLYAVSFFIACIILLISSSALNETFFKTVGQSFVSASHAFSRFVSDSERVGPGESISTRRFLIRNGILALKKTWGWGLGAGSDQVWQETLGSRTTSMHAFWIEILVNLGLLTGGIFIAWYFGTMAKLFFLYKRTSDSAIKYYSGSLSLGLLGFSVGAMSASSVVYVLPMWLALGLGCATIKIAKTSKLNDLKRTHTTKKFKQAVLRRTAV